ncbi:Gfo/Idh/MocA family protein [Halalkalicoccus jeotgali]|uniref:Oxidoreductase domain protein n=1 Tax=Halalkalicoccus jeotgali (strain DSM 18796 / CECT 7217 / JCM 14584 / KCTC 4019 / B3) TaxID=795797 RepID=D8J5R7_HALJB|nr:Gfo/Idh/MocA family oxidoreductase [Halalkalicoccus jeotgali]ADJ13723.1 oxidoreductase domain protein [Halalkalicoccus jeotgali B3]ELY34230.1 oxidoreductase domain-containing protein [Halalkalicoccus jeotgali B3]
MSEQPPIRAGVIGVGSMGQNHARVYRELPETQLVGVHDVDMEQAGSVADAFGTAAMGMDALLEGVDMVSIAVPTQFHYDTARECIEAGVSVLVEKPFVEDLENGRRLIELAEQRNAVLQVGHIERFNPAVMTLQDLLDDLEIIAMEARRLGPPVDRDIEDTAVMDLMIHDIDILLSLLDEDVRDVYGAGTRKSNYATATIQTPSGRIGQLTASRVTQQKVRELTITAENCRVIVDYIDQSIEITRQSLPEYVKQEGFRYRHENIVEQVLVERREPLKNELSAFAEAVRTGSEPVVTGEDGLQALSLARQIDELAASERSTPTDVA